MGAAIASSRSKKQVSAVDKPVVATPQAGGDAIEQIKQLAELRDKGILTEEEFSAKKKQLLGL